MLPGALLGWLVWSFLALYGAQGQKNAQIRDLIVVLDGGSVRLEQAGRYRQQVLQEQLRQGRHLDPELLLIRCPRTLSSPQPMPELLEGYDTVTQTTALSGWLQRRQSPPPQRVWIATDPSHSTRATALARPALRSSGITVLPADPPPPGPQEQRKLWRDLLRISLWRVTGRTGDFLVPQIIARKRAACGL